MSTPLRILKHLKLDSTLVRSLYWPSLHCSSSGSSTNLITFACPKRTLTFSNNHTHTCHTYLLYNLFLLITLLLIIILLLIYLIKKLLSISIIQACVYRGCGDSMLIPAVINLPLKPLKPTMSIYNYFKKQGVGSSCSSKSLTEAEQEPSSKVSV